MLLEGNIVEKMFRCCSFEDADISNADWKNTHSV
jgi:hypothetical protein